jgi:hypothetical protein
VNVVITFEDDLQLVSQSLRDAFLLGKSRDDVRSITIFDAVDGNVVEFGLALVKDGCWRIEVDNANPNQGAFDV